ncbi:MAG: hypothetical protein QOH26_904 [Actinomycetota bacterium]|nr:hypothetical protein [Actinomycetota bacterium]
MTALGRLEGESFCYLTTTGRVSGNPHEIEIWFASKDATIYMLAGGRDASDWVRNIRAIPDVSMRIAGETFSGRARVVSDTAEDAWAREALVSKYSKTSEELERWGRTALPVAVDLDV